MTGKQPAPLITPQMLYDWDACYSASRVAELYDGRKALTPLEVCELRIPTADRLWVVLRVPIIPAAELHELGLRFAASVAQHDRVIRAAAERLLDVKRQWLAGQATNAVLEAARHKFSYTGYGANAIYYAASPVARRAAYLTAQSICDGGVQTGAAYPADVWLDATRKTLARLYTEPTGDRCAE